MTCVCWSGRNKFLFNNIDNVRRECVEKIAEKYSWHHHYFLIQEKMRSSTGSEHLPKTKIFCASQHHILSRIICVWLPISKRVDIHEVFCYSNRSILHKMMMATFNSPHVFHNYAQQELVVYAHSNNITFGHNWVLPAGTHDPTTHCYHTDASRYPSDRFFRWLLFCTGTAGNFLIREVYGSSWSARTAELHKQMTWNVY